MSSIRNRQEGFEKKFAMDEESKFKAMARRNKLLGLWAAILDGNQPRTLELQPLMRGLAVEWERQRRDG